MAAPLGNQNAAKGKAWADAIRRAMARAEADGSNKAINALADKLLEKAADGDMAALKEVGDRLDGKPSQPVGGAEDLGPIEASIRVLYGDGPA
jgi:hypothetical protein